MRYGTWMTWLQQEEIRRHYLRKREDMETRNQSVFEEELRSHASGGWGAGLRPRSQPFAHMLMFLRWNSGQAPSMSFLCSRCWQVETRKREIGGCQVLTTAGNWVWLGPKLLTYDLPAFPIHLQTQEKSDFSIPLILFLQLPRKAMTWKFHSLGSHNQEQKLDPQNYISERKKKIYAIVIGL